MKLFFSIGILGFLCVSCSKGGSEPQPAPQPTIPASDTSLQKMLPFKFGAAVNVNLLQNNTKYSGVVKHEFNSLTAENVMKFSRLHPSENSYTWNEADYLVSFAQLNNKRVHGHTLIWHNSLPAWVTAFSGDSAAWENLLKTHIQTVVAHFKGKVTSWDVVNEAFNDDGTLRNSIWRQKLGDDYIARCFQYAAAADPDALLFYNDYGHEYSAPKRTAITNYLASLKTRGIPVHGIGMQFHTRYTQTDANIAAAITAAAATGLKVHISELDVALNPDNIQVWTYTSTLATQQAAKYKFIVKTFSAIPAAQQYGITTWNVGDADSWIPGEYSRPDWPLPFDASYNRKAAYYGIIDGVK